MTKLNEQPNFNPEQLRWDNTGAAAAQAVYQMRRVDDAGELLECATLDALMETLIDDGATFDGATFDALVVTNAKIEAKAKQLGAAFNRAGAAITVSENGVTVTKPFKKNGSTQICMIFEMTDGQTITVFLHNPDAKPNTLQASDVLISWKWLLNRKDITIVVAKEHGKDLAVAQVAARVMALVDKNAGRFAKANAGRAARMGAIASLEGEVAAHEATLKGLIEQISAKKDGKTGGEDKTAFGSFEPELFAYAAKAGLVVEKEEKANGAPQRYRILKEGVGIGYASVGGINAEALSSGLFTVGSFANNAHGAIAVIDKLLALGVAVSDVGDYVNDMAKQARENGFDKLAQLFESDAIYSTYPFDSLAAIAVDPSKTNNDFTTEATKIFKGALESSNNAHIINQILVARFGVTKSTAADESLSWKNVPFETTINELNSEYGTGNDFWEMSIEQARSLPDALAKRMIDALTNANYHSESLLLELKHGGFSDAVQLLQSNDAYSNHPFKQLFYAAMSGKEMLDKRAASIKDLDAGEIAQIQEVYAAFGFSVVPESKPIVLTGKELGDFEDGYNGFGLMADAAKQKIESDFMGKKYFNAHLKEDIEVRKSSSDKMTATKHGNRLKYQAISALPQILKQGTVTEFEASRKQADELNVKRYVTLEHDVTIAGNEVRARIKVKEDDKGNYAYDLAIKNTAKGSFGVSSDESKENVASLNSSVNKIVTDSADVVNQYGTMIDRTKAAFDSSNTAYVQQEASNHYSESDWVGVIKPQPIGDVNDLATKATLDSVAPVLSPPAPDNYSGSNEIGSIKPQAAGVNATFDSALSNSLAKELLDELGEQTLKELANDVDGAHVWSNDGMVNVKTLGHSIVVTKFFGKARSKSVSKTKNIGLDEIKAAGEKGVSKIIDALIKDCNQASKANFDSATFDAATGKMVLNLFLQIKDENGNWVDLPDEELVDEDVEPQAAGGAEVNSKPVDKHGLSYSSEYAKHVYSICDPILTQGLKIPENHVYEFNIKHQSSWNMGNAGDSISAYVNRKGVGDGEQNQLSIEVRVFLDKPRAILFGKRGSQYYMEGQRLEFGGGSVLSAASYEELMRNVCVLVNKEVEDSAVKPSPDSEAPQSEDVAFLQSIIDGKQSEAMASPDFADKLTDMYARVQGVEADLALFNRALQLYTDFVLEATK